MKLLIFYLTDNRRHYTFPHFINMLNESKYKNLWKLMVLTHTYDGDFYESYLNKRDIDHIILNVEQHNNYMNKVYIANKFAIQNQIPYMMKCDNDIFLKAETLDYIIDNLHLLENSNHLTIGPVLSSGIPGIEYFKEQFLDRNANEILNNLFLKTNFYDRDGASYEFLNNYTLHTSIWDKNNFFTGVKSMNHHYKGIHPIRINEVSLQFLNEYIITNKDKFYGEHNLSIINNDDSPYLCNSIYCIKTDIYNKIINDNSLFVDSFDEVPLNKYAWKNNMNHLFTKNGFAIHMYYNWKSNHLEYEKYFCSKFFS
jgi:hypothetical protein